MENGYRAVRVAGSGMMENTAADLIAGKKGKKFAIEAKSTKKSIQYITKEQIEDFIIFSSIFGLKPIVAVRFNREGWFFLKPKQLVDCGKNWCVSLNRARKKGKRLGQMF